MYKFNLPSVLLSSFILGILFLSTSCKDDQSAKQTNASAFEIPALLDRNEKIQMGKEWDYVQNFYSENRDAFGKNPEKHEALLNLIDLYRKEARITGEHGHYYPAALALANKILSENPSDKDIAFRTLLSKAGVELSLHEFHTALETGKKALALNPSNAQVYGVLVDAHVELGEYDEAVAFADRMISIKPDLRSYARVSYLREIHGDVDGAINAMEMAVKAGFPGYEETAWSMLTLGELYKTYGDNNKAEKIFQNILQDRPDYPFAIAALADIYYSAGDLKKAEKTLKEAINIIPEVGYYVQLAQIYKDQNRQIELDNIMDEIFAMLADDVEAGHNMNLEYAHIYLDVLENPNQALVYAKKEYAKRPNNIDVNRALAKIYLATDEFNKVDQHVVAASTTNSKHPELTQIKSKL